MSQLPQASPWKQAFAAARVNVLPAVALWSLAVGIILAYSFLPQVRDALDRVAAFKQEYGYAFSAISTPIFAALLPLLMQRLVRVFGARRIAPEPWTSLPFLVAFWAYRGAEIDGLYRLQAWLWGQTSTLGVVTVQVVIDQGGYVMLWAIPTMVVLLLFKDCGYSIGRTWRQLGRRWYRRRCVPILVVNWLVWIPAVIVIYSLPLGLRLPVMNINVCLFMMLVMVATARPAEAELVTAP